MTKHPLIRRPQQPPSPKLRGVPARRPFRLWMTGSIAVVMAAIAPVRDLSGAARSQATRVLRHSRYGVGETVRRIEIAARERGMSVLATTTGALTVLVLASSIGGTPVVMEEAGSQLAVPLSITVQASNDGGADVLVASTTAGAASDVWEDLPAAVADDLAALPALVDRALV